MTLTSGSPLSRKFQILNEGQSKVELYWIHPQTRDAVIMSNPDIIPGAEFPLDSFVAHEFEVRELKCQTDIGSCKKCGFAVSSNEDQVVRINNDIECLFEDNKVKARKEAEDMVADCHKEALDKVNSASNADVTQAMKDLVSCVQGGVAEKLEDINEEIAFQSTVRKDIAGQLENYTCMDDTMDSSPTIEEKMWRHDQDPGAGTRRVQIKHERPASKIHVIENFIMEDECIAMEEAAKKSLHRATVADGRGGSKYSENRKALQAGITVNWQKEKDGDPIARLSRRVYDYTNDVLGLNIEEHGQEDLMSIQYEGRGKNDTEPDRYTPHCDGDCTGLPHKEGTRMATMVMYCTVADQGGHTNFRNAGVHVKPQSGNAIFFSYIDPKARVMDTGFTEHSGCPVFEGEKKIVTQWIRLGVDKENPWNSFNTLGIKHSVAAKYQDGEEAPEEEEDDEDMDEEEEGAGDEL